MTSKNVATGTEVSKITYPIHAESGGRYYVDVDPVDETTRCTCKAGENGKDCKHQYAVRLLRGGRIGKPVIRGHQCQPKPRRTQVSAETREHVSMLDVG